MKNILRKCLFPSGWSGFILWRPRCLDLLFLAFEYVERKEIDMYQRAEITSRFAIMEHIIEDKASRADWKDFKEQIQEFTPPSGGTIIRADSDDPFSE